MSEFEAGLMKTNGANESNPKTKLLGVDNSKGYSGNQNATDGIPKESLSSPNAAELLKRIEEIDDNLHLHKKSIDLATHGMLLFFMFFL